MESSTGKKRKRSSSTPGEPGTAGQTIGSSGQDSFPTTSSVPTRSNGGSSVNLVPRDVNVIAFAEKRSREIRTLLDALTGTKMKNKRVFQQLPRHMRRRAMSYNVKRLPKRVRAAAENEINKAKKPKRSRTKYRKRGRNKTLLFARRQKSKCWLETHVWHAKRFHMVEKWGYKLAHHANDKGFRATFRASDQHCILSDLSFFNCWEFCGPQQVLLDGLQQFTSPEIGRTFACKDYLDGHLEGSCLLFEPSKYPVGAIGPVRFTWLPGKGSDRKLHIWIHPAMSATFLVHVLEIFGMGPVETEISSDHDRTDDAMEIEEVPVSSVTVQAVSAPAGDTGTDKPTTGDSTNEFRSAVCRLRCLKKELIRFRLTGPESTMVLKSVLKPFLLKSERGSWWKTHSGDGDSEMANIWEKQYDVWTNVEPVPLPTDIRPGSVLGLVVRDPRLFRPKKKMTGKEIKAAYAPGPSSSGPSKLPNRLFPLASSPIWDQGIRAGVKRDKLSDFKMNQLRSDLPAPGIHLDLGEEKARVPVVLIRNGGYNQQSDQSKTDYGGGWDLIVPSGWAMSFWIPLVYNGARVAGLQEMETIDRHRAALAFPVDFPDSTAGALCAAERRQELEKKFQRYPPDKRPNYLKMGTLTPFHSSWPVLVQDWIDIVKYAPTTHVALEEAIPRTFHVVRNLRLLSFVQNVLVGELSTENLMASQPELTQQHARGLVAVHFLFHGGGTFEEFSMVNLPSEEDYQALASGSGFTGPVEPAHKDPFRKTEPPKQRRKMQVTEILSDKDSVVDHCSRKLIGYTVKGGYNFIRGSDMALGFCTLLGLLQLARAMPKGGKKGCVGVLVRHPHSLQYHFVQLSLLPFSL